MLNHGNLITILNRLLGILLRYESLLRCKKYLIVQCGKKLIQLFGSRPDVNFATVLHVLAHPCLAGFL